MRTGRIAASALSAIMAVPSYTFMMEPVTVMRPSGKITIVSPPLTALTSVRAASGRVGSSRYALIALRNGFTHHAVAICELTANDALLGRMVCSSGPSSRLTWLGAMMARSPAPSRFSRPFTSR